MLAWRCEHRIRRREDLLSILLRQRARAVSQGWSTSGTSRLSPVPIAPLGASPLDAPGSIILEDLESVSTTPTSSRCLDVILTNVDYLTEGIVEHVDFSDHAMVLATTKHVRVTDAVKPTGIEKTSTKLAKSTCRNTRLSIGAYYESFIIFWT